MPAAATEAGMGSVLNSTGLPPALLLILTTSNVTDTLSPGTTALGILTASCRSPAASTAVVGAEAAEVKGSARAVVYSGPTMTPPSSHALPYTSMSVEVAQTDDVQGMHALLYMHLGFSLMSNSAISAGHAVILELS